MQKVALAFVNAGQEEIREWLKCKEPCVTWEYRLSYINDESDARPCIGPNPELCVPDEVIPTRSHACHIYRKDLYKGAVTYQL